VARQHKPDWEILGKDPSGALLVARINHTAVHKCCPACFQQDTLRGPLRGWLVENGPILWCPDCEHVLVVKDEEAEV